MPPPGNSEVHMEQMSHVSSQTPRGGWTPVRIVAVAVIILVLGVCVGYLFSGSPSQIASTSMQKDNQTSGTTSQSQSQQPFDSSIHLLLQRLSSNPDNSNLLVTIGDQYYDHRDYERAVEYYRRSLALRPEDVDVRTDMGTAIWYMGNPDGAIREYETSLKLQPNHPQTLFNMGIVKWQGKHDGKAALELWQRLLRVNPTYPDRQKVEQLIQQVQTTTK